MSRGLILYTIVLECVRERESVLDSVCVLEGERERESVCVCVSVSECV